MKNLVGAMLATLAAGMFVLPHAVALETSGQVAVTTLMKSDTSWNGQKLAWPEGEAEVSMLKVEIAPGGETGWHLHPVPSFGIVLKGTLEVTLKDGRVKRLKEGEVLAEVVDTLHNGRNVGEGTVQLLVFYAGARGVPLSRKPTP